MEKKLLLKRTQMTFLSIRKLFFFTLSDQIEKVLYLLLCWFVLGVRIMKYEVFRGLCFLMDQLLRSHTACVCVLPLGFSSKLFNIMYHLHLSY